MKFALPAGSRSAEFGTWMIVSVLATPSFFLLFTCPPLWRDTDGFNQVASTFAPMGIIHWLPGYCLLGRLIMIIGGVIGSVLTGHGIPYLSIGTPTLNDAGIYSLVVFQHAFLVASLWYLIEALTDRFWLRLVFAGFLVFTPWLYLFAHCIGSEAFSNPLMILTIAAGWKCLKPDYCRTGGPSVGTSESGLKPKSKVSAAEPRPQRCRVATAGWAAALQQTSESGLKLATTSRRSAGGFFLFLLLAALTRQINGLLAIALPLTLLVLTGIYRVQAFTGTPNAERQTPNAKRRTPTSRFEFFARRFAVFLGLSVLALGGSIAIQIAMCWAFRVPYRTTFGRTFEWRLRYLASLSADDRTRLFNRFSSELKDPMLSSALSALNDSLARDPDWKALFLFQNLDTQLEAAGVMNQQIRAYQADLKLNRLAGHFLLPPEANYVRATWDDFKKVPFLSQADLSRSPFYTTSALQNQLAGPRYARLRSLATFQYDSSFFVHRWDQVPYFHALGWVPMFFLAGAAILFTVTTWVFVRRDGEILVGTIYIGTLIVLGGLFAFANCASTDFDARYFLPVYTCFQIALILSVSILLSPLDSTIALEGDAPPSPRG